MLLCNGWDQQEVTVVPQTRNSETERFNVQRNEVTDNRDYPNEQTNVLEETPPPRAMRYF